MKRRRKAPDWRCPGVEVFRDVQPGRVPLRINLKGRRPIDVDFPAGMVAQVEAIARKERRTFGFTFCTLALRGMELKAGEAWKRGGPTDGR